MKRTYTISKQGIFCEKCHNQSHNATDIRRLYCGYCQAFHSPHDWLYTDLFNNGFIYDERNLVEDSLTMHENLVSGKWRILLIALTSDEQSIQKINFFGLKQPTMMAHEIGGQEAIAFISQEQMSDSEIEKFTDWFKRTLIIGQF